MTAWTSNELPQSLRVPGVYGVPRRRVQAAPAARTDVAGFIGFEPRVRCASAALVSDAGGAVGHQFLLSLADCRVPFGNDGVDSAGFDVTDDSRQIHIVAASAFELSSSTTSVPMAVGQAIRFALAVVDADWTETADDYRIGGDAERKRCRRRRNVVVVPGAAAAIGADTAPTDKELEIEIAIVATFAWDEAHQIAGNHSFARLVDVQVQRVSNDGFAVVIIPAQRVVRCDDWRDFVLRLGLPQEDGTFLGHSVRGFFACGGSRCFISLVDRPEFDNQSELNRVLAQMVGDDGDSITDATGVARLLHVPDVAVIDLPDLYALRTIEPPKIQLPPAQEDECFRPCRPMPVVTDVAGPVAMGEPLYDSLTITDTQIQLVERCIPYRWRIFLLFSPPITQDPTTGLFGPPGVVDAEEWQTAFHNAITKGGVGEQDEVSVAALYYPWLLVQESAGAAERSLPPTGFVAGVIASRDLRRGPAVSPANELIVTALGTTVAITDEVLADLYDPETDNNGYARPAVNLLRQATGGGVELWGARTLSTETWLRFVSVRRGLSAVQRRCHAALQRIVFEPNTPVLWMQVTQIVLNVLMTLFRSGALRGAEPQEAFYIRCDSSLNPPESVAEGKLLIEVGVAIAAPAEFLVFRLGRSEGIVEVLE